MNLVFLNFLDGTQWARGRSIIASTLSLFSAGLDLVRVGHTPSMVSDSGNNKFIT